MARAKKPETIPETPVQEAPVQETPETRLYTEAEVQTMVAEMVRKFMAEQQPKEVVYVTKDTEWVEFLWQAPVAEENEFLVGDNGRFGHMHGQHGTFRVPKHELSGVMTEQFRGLMKERWIIVLSGLTDEERITYGVDYKPGEILDKGSFAKLVEIGDRILELYPQLCTGHREIVKKKYVEAFTNGSEFVTRERVLKLREICRSLGDDDAAFRAIIDGMNEQDSK